MRYAGIDGCELCNGLDIGMSLYVQGCRARCRNCFNPETWDFGGGMEWTGEAEERFFRMAGRPYIKRVSFLGGEPLTPESVRTVASLVGRLKREHPGKKVWIYTGWLFRELASFRFSDSDEEQDALDRILDGADYLVDGRYEDALRDPSLAFRGSGNQTIWRRDGWKWEPADL